MIVSASYKTDIPAFYGEWFMRRLDAGFCRMRNPYGGQLYEVPLGPEHVDGFVFWTKNLGPFLERLAEVSRRGYPFVVQYAINGYPRELEFAVVDAARSVGHMKRLATEYGPRVPVWRYDTIVISSLTPPDFHRRNFPALARALEGSADEVVVSFAQIYRKTKRNMDAAARQFGFTWEDPATELKHSLVKELAACAASHRMKLTVCAQPEYLAEGVVHEARCIDAIRLSDVAGRPIGAALKGNRPGCACYYSRDIGDYDTCPHGCVYCYAVQHRALARRRFEGHDPAGEFLFTPSAEG